MRRERCFQSSTFQWVTGDEASDEITTLSIIRSHQTPEWVSAHTFLLQACAASTWEKKKSLLVKSWCTQVFPGNGGHVFLCMSEFLFAFTFFYVNSGKENKNIMTGLKEITGCHSSEAHVCVCREVKLACADMSVWMVTAEGGREGTHMCDTWGADRTLFSHACPHLIIE